MLSIDIARTWYSSTDPVHGFDHVLRVYHLAEYIALVEGADLEIVRAAVLLHDVEVDRLSPAANWKTSIDEQPDRTNHHLSSADFARQILKEDGWDDLRIQAVVHCIRAHRFRDNSQSPQSLEAKILFDADKLDAIGAIGVMRAIGYAITHGQPVYAEPSERFVQSGQLEPGEPHSSYHEFIYKLRRLKDCMYTRVAREIAEERHQFMEEYYLHLQSEWVSSLAKP